MRMHLITATAAALALSATAAPVASADTLYGLGKDIAYAIHVEGQGKYEYSERTSSGEDWNGHDASLTFTYNGDIGDGVVFRNASPLDTTGDDLPSGAAQGTYVNTSSSGSETCTLDPTWFPLHGWMRILDDADISNTMPLDGSMDLWIRPFEQLDQQFDCPGDGHPGVYLGRDPSDGAVDSEGHAVLGHNPFDMKFNLPRDIIGMGYVEQLIPLQVKDGTACPGWMEDTTVTCHFEWSAKVELRKLWEKAAPTSTGSTDTTTQPQPTTKPPLADDDLLMPLVPPKPPVNDDDDLLMPLVPASKASLSADASTASFSVSCSAGCSGSASLTAGTGAKVRAAAAKAKAVKPLARTAFKVAKGKSKRVTLKLGAKARRAVRKAGGARIVVRVTSGSKTTSRTLTVRVPKRGAHR